MSVDCLMASKLVTLG